MSNVIPQQQPKVWQVLAESCNLSEATARRICRDFDNADNDIHLPADGLASEHSEYIAGMYAWLENPDIRNDILAGDEVTSHIADNSDPFYYAVKISPAVVHKHVAPAKPSAEPIACSICQDTATKPVRLSCKCSFCEECVVPWITLSCARCPNCRSLSREHVVPIKAVIRSKPPALKISMIPVAPVVPTSAVVSDPNDKPVETSDDTANIVNDTVTEIMKGKTKIIIALKARNPPPVGDKH